MTPAQAEIARLYAARWQPAEIAKRRGCSIRTVYQHAYAARRRGVAVPDAERGRPPRKADWMEYLRLYRAGWRNCRIAQHFGVTDGVVCRALRILRESGADMTRHAPLEPSRRHQR